MQLPWNRRQSLIGVLRHTRTETNNTRHRDATSLTKSTRWATELICFPAIFQRREKCGGKVQMGRGRCTLSPLETCAELHLVYRLLPSRTDASYHSVEDTAPMWRHQSAPQGLLCWVILAQNQKKKQHHVGCSSCSELTTAAICLGISWAPILHEANSVSSLAASQLHKCSFPLLTD